MRVREQMGGRNKGKKKTGRECASPFILPYKVRSEIRGGGAELVVLDVHL